MPGVPTWDLGEIEQDLTFRHDRQTVLPPPLTLSPPIPLSDFNGGGQADLLWRHGSSGTVVGWLMNGLNIQSAGSLGTINPVWQLQ